MSDVPDILMSELFKSIFFLPYKLSKQKEFSIAVSLSMIPYFRPRSTTFNNRQLRKCGYAGGYAALSAISYVLRQVAMFYVNSYA